MLVKAAYFNLQLGSLSCFNHRLFGFLITLGGIIGQFNNINGLLVVDYIGHYCDIYKERIY